MNRKTSLYLVALLAVMTLLVLPPASATEHDEEANAAIIEAAISGREVPKPISVAPMTKLEMS